MYRGHGQAIRVNRPSSYGETERATAHSYPERECNATNNQHFHATICVTGGPSISTFAHSQQTCIIELWKKAHTLPNVNLLCFALRLVLMLGMFSLFLLAFFYISPNSVSHFSKTSGPLRNYRSINGDMTQKATGGNGLQPNWFHFPCHGHFNRAGIQPTSDATWPTLACKHAIKRRGIPNLCLRSFVTHFL